MLELLWQQQGFMKEWLLMHLPLSGIESRHRTARMNCAAPTFPGVHPQHAGLHHMTAPAQKLHLCTCTPNVHAHQVEIAVTLLCLNLTQGEATTKQSTVHVEHGKGAHCHMTGNDVQCVQPLSCSTSIANDQMKRAVAGSKHQLLDTPQICWDITLPDSVACVITVAT